MPEATTIAHSLTLDHMILDKDSDLSRKRDRVATVLLDVYTKWLAAIAALTNSAQETMKAIRIFLDPQTSPEHVYSDN